MKEAFSIFMLCLIIFAVSTRAIKAYRMDKHRKKMERRKKIDR
ncbi:MAG: hypothetical protein ACPG5P_08245 [Saprospiraceae bacterium]